MYEEQGSVGSQKFKVVRASQIKVNWQLSKWDMWRPPSDHYQRWLKYTIWHFAPLILHYNPDWNGLLTLAVNSPFIRKFAIVKGRQFSTGVEGGWVFSVRLTSQRQFGKMKREFLLNDWSSCRNFWSTRNLIYLCQIFVIWRENQTSEIKVFKIFQPTIMNSSMDEVKEKEIAFLPGNFYNVRFSENYCFAVHKGDAESLSWCESLWCIGQGDAWTCRSTGFDYRRRCFPFLCIVFGLFF